MPRRPAGVFGPVVSTFDDRTGELDLDAFAFNIRAHIAAGLSGVVVAGSTGEAALLDEEERLRLIETARELVPASDMLIVGTGAESTRQCVRRSRDAAARGADMVLVVAPHYYGSSMTRAALEAHYRRVADDSPCPVLLYNIPKYAHFTLEPELIAALSTHGNIAGMKDSAGDLGKLEGYLLSQGERFTVLTGHAGTFLQALERGVHGGILAAALFAPEPSLDVWQRRNGTAAAKVAQDVLAPLGLEIVARMGVAGVKAAMDAVGLRGGAVRSPLQPLPAADRAQVQALLRRAGVAVGV